MWKRVAISLGFIVALPVVCAEAKDMKAEPEAQHHGFERTQNASAGQDASLAAGSFARAYAAVATRLGESEDVKKAAEVLRRGLEKANDAYIAVDLAAAYAAVAERLSDTNDIKRAAEALRRSLEKAQDPDVAAALATAYAKVAARLSDTDDIKKAAEVLRRTLEKAQDAYIAENR